MSEPSEITPEFVAEVQRRMADMEARNTHLEAHLRVSEMLRADLERMLKHERHTRWGATSETLGEDQRHLPFEDIEVVQGMLEQASAEAEKATRKGPQAPKPRRSNKGNLPEHLPREETVIEPETTDCPCDCGEMEPIGEDRSDRLDSEPFSAIGPRTMASPAQFRVLVTVRPKYMCRACQGKSHAEAPAPDYLVPRGLPTEALMAHVLVAKFGDHLPFYRQSDMYRRQGVDLDRTVLANWAGRAGLMMMPVVDAMIAELARCDRLFCDETTGPVLAPGPKKTRKTSFGPSCAISAGGAAAIPPLSSSTTPDIETRRLRKRSSGATPPAHSPWTGPLFTTAWQTPRKQKPHGSHRSPGPIGGAFAIGLERKAT